MRAQQGEIMLVDKPVGFSSFQIVRLLKRKYTKVGHAGTLDPFASGLLIVLIGPATRRFNEFQKYDKEYCGEIMLGYVTDTYDITGQLSASDRKADDRSLEDLEKIAGDFAGDIEQVPPRFSALKHGGRKLYELSRSGRTVRPPTRKVHIKSFTITIKRGRFIGFSAVVGKGTYIRSLAHDFGQRCGCGAVLLSLRRTRIGGFHVGDAHSFGSLLRMASD